MKKTLTILVLSLLFVACGGAGEKVELTYNLNEGDSFAQQMTTNADMLMTMMGQPVDVNVKVTFDFTYTVKSIEGNSYNIEIVFDRLAQTIDMPMAGVKTTIDTGDEAEAADITQEKLKKFYLSMIGKPFAMKMTNKGKIEELSGFDAIIDSMELVMDEMELADEEKEQFKNIIKQSHGSDNFISNFNMSSAIYPDYPVAKGDKWEQEIDYNSGMKLTFHSTYEFLGETDGVYNVSVVADIKTGESEISSMNMMNIATKVELEGSMKSNITINKKTCWHESSSSTMDMSGVMKMEKSEMMPEDIEVPITYKINIGMKAL